MGRLGGSQLLFCPSTFRRTRCRIRLTGGQTQLSKYVAAGRLTGGAGGSHTSLLHPLLQLLLHLDTTASLMHSSLQAWFGAFRHMSLQMLNVMCIVQMLLIKHGPKY